MAAATVIAAAMRARTERAHPARASECATQNSTMPETLMARPRAASQPFWERNAEAPLKRRKPMRSVSARESGMAGLVERVLERVAERPRATRAATAASVAVRWSVNSLGIA